MKSFRNSAREAQAKVYLKRAFVFAHLKDLRDIWMVEG
jgi:hypothetical protein